MRSSDQATFVRYGFFALTLFEGYDELNHYDVPASARKYAESCRQRLQAEYPRARVEVVAVEDDDVEGALPGPMQTQVLVSAEDEIDSSVPLELEDTEMGEGVDQICKEIFESYEWLVLRPWLNLEEAGKRFQIPISALHWLCSNGFISEAERASSGWELPRESLADFRKEHKELFDPGSILSVVGLESEMVSFKPYPGEMLFAADWPAPGEMWIAPAAPLKGLPFNAEDWSLLIDRQSIVLEHHFCPAHWKGDWVYPRFARVMISEAQSYGIKTLVEISQMTFKSIRLPDSPLTPHQSAQHLATELDLAQQNVTIVLLGGPKWKPEYEKDEVLFCREILEPLLRRMGCRNVRCTHGKKERGRDFVFSEMTRFNDFVYYAVQAKAGNVSGGVNSDIDEILGQLDDGFKMDYVEPGCAPVYIAVFIVAISGHFTENAEDKIRQKMPKGISVGAVHFWDQAKILSLIRQYWGNVH